MHISDPSLHLKLQEMCDCYLDTSYKTQLARIGGQPGPDPDDEAMRYLALALMHAITEQAGELKFKQDGKGVRVTVKREGDKESLPAPPPPLFAKILGIVRAILHLEGEKGESPLSLGLRTGSVDLRVKVKEKGEEASLKIEFAGAE